MPQPLCTPGLPRIPTSDPSFPDPCHGTRCTMVAKHIKFAASAHGKVKQQVQTPAQEKTERLSVHSSDSRRRESYEKTCRCKRPVLGSEEGSAGVVNPWHTTSLMNFFKNFRVASAALRTLADSKKKKRYVCSRLYGTCTRGAQCVQANKV